jgi:HK97 family phage major capsid protein
MDIQEIKNTFDAQGQAFEALKAELAARKSGDALTEEKIGRIESSLDAAVEKKAAIEAALSAEVKAREELEASINRLKLGGLPEGQAIKAVELKTFNNVLSAQSAARNRAFTPLDEQGYADYKAAADRYFREGKENLSPEEVKTLAVGSDPDGGYFVTPDLTGRMVRKVYETSPMRQVASVQTISTDALEGMEDLGEGGAGYAGERSQGSDSTTPQVGKWRIEAFWIDSEPKATQQLLDDAEVDVEAWLAGKVGDKFARFENAEFVTGATKIRGITSYTTAADDGSGVTWGTLGHIVTGVSGDFAASAKGDKLYDVVGALKDQYLANARWMARRATVTAIRKFKDGQGNYMWQPSFVLGQPETILGHPVTRAEDMPAMAANSLSLAFGDFTEAYQIVDRQGVRVLRDPYTAKPYIKFYTTKRTGGGVVNFEAIKFLKFGT